MVKVPCINSLNPYVTLLPGVNFRGVSTIKKSIGLQKKTTKAKEFERRGILYCRFLWNVRYSAGLDE